MTSGGPRDVWKFGGEALADGPAVARVVRRIADACARGASPVVVVSAHAGVTDLLDATAQRAAHGDVRVDDVRLRHRGLAAQLGLSSEPLDRFWRELATLLEHLASHGAVEPAERDAALSFGERLSARLVSAALVAAGVDATPVDAWDAGLVTDSRHGAARPLDGVGEAVRAALAHVPGVPVVTGFLGKDRAGRATTLGRNGSDLTASVLAEALGARELCFWKPVGGILSADPRLVPDARLLDAITYAEAAELAFHGARVLHPAAVAPVVRAAVAVRVRGVDDGDGTVFAPTLERAGPVSVACRARVVGVEVPVDAPERRAERAAQLFAALEAHGVAPGPTSCEGERLVVYVEPCGGVPAALAQLAEHGARASVRRDLASLALVGHGVGGRAEVLERALAALADAGVHVVHAAPAEGGAACAFVVPEGDLSRAVRRLHALVTVERCAARR